MRLFFISIFAVMKVYLKHIKILSYRLLLLAGLLQATRVYFFISNYSKFSDTNVGKIIWAFIVGIRFDLVSIGIFNSLFILLSILPLAIITKRAYQYFIKFLFIIVNTLLIFTNLFDSEYFKFTQKRATFDIVDLIKSDDFINMSGGYLKDYWYVFLIGLILTYLLIRFYPKNPNQPWLKPTSKIRIKQIVLGILILGVSYGTIRGLDLKPITITSAAKFASPETISLVLNTPFTIINTINKKGVSKKNYFSDNEIKHIFSPIKHFSKKPFKPMNVVILILESFGKEYSHLNNPNSPGYTPFLDSLSQQGLRFRYSFANGKRSMEALPSIFNSTPSLMDKAYAASPYAANRTEGLANILKKEGYYTSFMHGGANGTMYFDKFCYMSGFEDYYGKNEYPNSKDYDGNWGIFDEPYLQYVVKKMSEFKQPFFNSVFTLSSHHPYTIPDKYKGVFPKGTSVIHESIGYADHALKEFFDSAKKEAWYNNTLFVISADHTSISEQTYFQKSLGAYAIPIIFFQTKDSLLKGESLELMQQIDIMPSILDYLNYNKPFYSLGNSAFDSTANRFIINHINDRYYFIHDNLYTANIEDSVYYIFDFPKDSLLKKNLVKNKTIYQEYQNKSDSLFKAVIQTFNNDLINNRSYPANPYYSNKKD